MWSLTTRGWGCCHRCWGTTSGARHDAQVVRKTAPPEHPHHHQHSLARALPRGSRGLAARQQGPRAAPPKRWQRVGLALCIAACPARLCPGISAVEHGNAQGPS